MCVNSAVVSQGVQSLVDEHAVGGHEVRVALDPRLRVHPRQRLLEEGDDLVVGARRSELRHPDGLAGHVVHLLELPLEVAEVGRAVVPVASGRSVLAGFMSCRDKEEKDRLLTA